MLEVTLHPYKNGICEKDISYKKGDIGSDDFLSLLGLEGHVDVAISIYDDGDIEISDISGRVGGDDEIAITDGYIEDNDIKLVASLSKKDIFDNEYQEDINKAFTALKKLKNMLKETVERVERKEVIIYG
ncbi:hypothetical protein ACTQXV_01220 [Ligilactobacillus salivarius]|uniref:Uncharacterized protein n=1 Tax=Ligilactobacillus salivarius TaxID=1624 RepID=A0A089QJ70_9LACO|nr:hypothetical protein [Ligilactobacillus salivarius]AIR11818.1 Hypothetical protein LSJ_4041 [Ligilactobacillus salivarius]OYP91361.1 hypothetical protein B9G67_05400 [Ligilactobacillus salivarius]